MNFWSKCFYLIGILFLVDAESPSMNPMTTGSSQGKETKWSPKKPVLEWSTVGKPFFPTLQIHWIRCGRNRECDEIDKKTELAIRYKPLESNHWLEIPASTAIYYRILVLPGKIYELIGISKIGDLWNESECIEMFLAPGSSPVQSVKYIGLSNTSLLISWKPPRQSVAEVNWYGICSVDLNDRDHLFDFQDMDLKGQCKSESSCKKMDYQQTKIVNLKPNTQYRFYIIPNVDNENVDIYQHGLEYVLDYFPAAGINEINLPLAKPEFKVAYFKYLGYRILWYPGGPNFDFNGTKPGSDFEFQIKNSASHIIHSATVSDLFYHEIDNEVMKKLIPGEHYEVIVRSIDGDETSEAVSKTLKYPDDWK